MSTPVPEPTNLAYCEAAPTVRPELTAHSRKMTQKVYEVGDRIYVAVGYGIANCTMVEGDDGVIIIDVMESMAAARDAFDALRKLCDKPVKAIVLTHNHVDHIFGMHVFASPEDVAAGRIEIYAHEDLTQGLLDHVSVVRGAIAYRASFSLGHFLGIGDEGRINAGIGPEWRKGEPTFIAPTTTFRDTLEVEVAGVRMQLVHAPSETDDEIVVWFPDLGALQSAEVIQGECFPNLHTIRGTPYRDPVNWYQSIDRMRGFGAEHLVPSHGRPVTGKAQVAELLTAYRDAIQYTHDQAVRLINKGHTPDELAEALPGLPAHLKDHPWLGEFYGTVKHAVRQVFQGYLGWFEGDPTFLDPLPRPERARRYVEMMGGRDAVVASARDALDSEEFEWAAEILTHVIRVDVDDREARGLKARALRALGFAQLNINWRYWYLSSALELEDKLPQQRRRAGGPQGGIMAALPTAKSIETASVRLIAERCLDVSFTAGFAVTDTGEEMALEIRRGVAEYHSTLPLRVDIRLEAAKSTIIALLSKAIAVDEALAGGQLQLRGETAALHRFLDYFEPPVGEALKLTLR